MSATAKDREIEDLVAADQIQLVFNKAVHVFPGSMINAGGYTLLVWRDVPHGPALAWLAAVLLVAAGRLWLRRAFLRRPRDVAESRRFARWSALGSFVNGLAWGSMALFVYPAGSVNAQLFQAIVLAATTGVAGSLSASHVVSFYAFALPAVLPMAVRLGLGPDWFHRILGAMLLVFAVQMAQLARVTGAALRAEAQMRFRLAALNHTLEERVAERTGELAASLAGRDEFLSVASHELRTPVTSLRLSAQSLEEMAGEGGLGRAPAEQVARALDTLVQQSRHLGRLIEQMLDVSRIAAGAFDLTLEDGVDLVALVHAVMARLEREAARAGCEVKLEAPPTLRGRWDAGRLEQAIGNVLGNALKFGRGAPVEVHVAERPEGALVTVVDRGIGIAHELQPYIFDRFKRGVSSRHYGGLGLGLYIVRQIVEAHHGSIAVASEPGAGAAFTIALPLDGARH